jgi:nucleoside-diphosphate-sugar epimerase
MSGAARPAVLVLGATGCVGGAIARAVAASPHWRLVVGARRAPEMPVGEVRLADATDALQLARAFAGIDCVINAAGGSPAVLRRTAEAVCASAREMPGLRRVVHISSMAVYGPAVGLVAEDAPLLGGSAYADAKVAAEAAVMDYVASGRDAVILRPGIVHGPGSAQWTQRMVRLLRAGRLGDLGAAGDGWANLIHEDDLGAACLAACGREGARGLAINVGARCPPTWNEYLVGLARAQGAVPVRRIGARKLAIEARLLAPVLAVAGKVAKSRRVPDPIPPSLLRLFAQSIRLDATRADAILQFVRAHEDAAPFAQAA